ncbi:hypothetical protein NQ317_008710 [Molorchus minor]|uniref:Peptidase aspartic putative domain-containing protein n=1 Tax=Molorchus minor TaxID=1323400 RepID=A0ABQ9J297_9CUCU|nr:hypothetical protein NQ317_008710 [Molorchus minor]
MDRLKLKTEEERTEEGKLGYNAALVIKSLEISSANYEVAWNALLERYDNNKLLIHNHIKSLFNGEIILKESSSGIRKLIDDFSKNLRALEQLQQPVKEWDALLVYIISTKLDNTTLREWENSKSELEQPKFQDIKSFLNARADMLEMVAQNSVDKRKNYSYNTRSFLATENPDIRQCVICRDTHYVQNCKNFLKLPPAERDKKARSLHLCINCLKRGHHSKVCRRGTCNKCSKKHHTLLHQEPCAQPTLSNSNQNANVENTSDVADTSVETSVTLSACGSVDHVFLSTAYVQVIAQDGSTHTIRALLDCGAQSSFITKRVSERLKLNTLSANVSVRSVNNISSNVRSKCKLTIQSLYNNYSSNQWFFVIDTIAEDVPAPSKIDMLIGSDLFWDLLCVGQISLGLNNPVLQKTKFGWIISGPINLKTDVVICNLLQYLDEEPDVQKCLTKFWELEQVPSKPLANENSEKYPKLANIIRTDFYVDDLLTGADEVEEAAEICSGVSAILKQGGFQLRKFYSNNKDVLKYVDCTGSDFSVIDFGEHENAKTLDSTIVLGWLKQPANKLKTFISNRVAEIQELTISDKWRHVVSKHNPADIVSRGIKPKVLVNSIMWWKGPPFLSQDETNWPKSCSPSDNLPDMRKLKKDLFVIPRVEENIINRYSDLDKLKRTTAYILRFVRNCRRTYNEERITSLLLTMSEIQQAMIQLIKMSQTECFQKEINNLAKGKSLKNSKLVSLNPFVDSDGILRVRGRLNNSEFPFEKKHPCILSSQSHLAQLIVRHAHLRLLHAGPQHTLATIREEYWIVGGTHFSKANRSKMYPMFQI